MRTEEPPESAKANHSIRLSDIASQQKGTCGLGLAGRLASAARALEAKLAACPADLPFALRETARTACVAEAVLRLTACPSSLPYGERCAGLLRRHSDLLAAFDALAPSSAALEGLATGGLYEAFLARSDAGHRAGRGVFCTPPSLARFIARSVDCILRDDLGVVRGLSGLGEGDLVLDPAAGTGAFLQAALRVADDPAGLGRHLAGIDIDPAALVVCAAALAAAGAGFPRLVHGDALADPERCTADLRSLRETAPVAVVLGNPPYLGRSANRGRWISDLLHGRDSITGQPAASYFACEGRPLGERNAKWVSDDYVKFLRFAQWRIERTGWGVIGFVVNHGFLDGGTFRGMRESLAASFDSIRIVDLHGNANRKERAPDGGRDENMFPVRQGVAVVFLTRRKGGHARRAAVRHAELWGRRDGGGSNPGKIAWLNSHHIGNVAWTEVRPQRPFFILKPAPVAADTSYAASWSLDGIFPLRSLGIATARDRLAIRFTAAEMTATAEAFAAGDTEQARAAFGIGPDGADWRVADAQSDLRAHPEAMARPVPILYRPFDLRWTIYTGRSRGFLCRPRRRVMDHLVDGASPALLFSRGIETPDGWAHVFVARGLAQLHAVALKEVNQVAPLWLKSREGTAAANLAPEWTSALAAATGLAWQSEFGPDEAFGYIYAMLHAPSYRARHQEALRHGYPCVPLPSGADRFLALADLGQALIAVHLSPGSVSPVGEYQGPPAPGVERVRFTEGCAAISGEARFTGVSERIWMHRVGGYQIARRWLEDRRGRVLTVTERDHYQAVLAALAATQDLAGRIDEALEA